MGERLKGTDGKLLQLTLGEEVTTGEITAGEYLITGIAEELSELPAGAKVGHILPLGAITLGDGDAVRPVTEVPMAYTKSFNIDLSRAEIDMTALDDEIMIYEVNEKVDMTGSMVGQVRSGEAGLTKIQSRFIEVVELAADDTVEVEELNNEMIYFKGYIAKPKANRLEVQYIIFPAKLTGLTGLGASGESGAQEFTCNLRPTYGEVRPALYKRTYAA